LDTLERIAALFSHGLDEEEIQEELDLEPVELLVIIGKFLRGELEPAEDDFEE